MTNSERMVTLCAAFCRPPSEAKADWEILPGVGRRLGYHKELGFANCAEVYAEFVKLTGDRPNRLLRFIPVMLHGWGL